MNADEVDDIGGIFVVMVVFIVDDGCDLLIFGVCAIALSIVLDGDWV